MCVTVCASVSICWNLYTKALNVWCIFMYLLIHLDPCIVRYDTFTYQLSFLSLFFVILNFFQNFHYKMRFETLGIDYHLPLAHLVSM